MIAAVRLNGGKAHVQSPTSPARTRCGIDMSQYAQEDVDVRVILPKRRCRKCFPGSAG